MLTGENNLYFVGEILNGDYIVIIKVNNDGSVQKNTRVTGTTGYKSAVLDSSENFIYITFQSNSAAGYFSINTGTGLIGSYQYHSNWRNTEKVKSTIKMNTDGLYWFANMQVQDVSTTYNGLCR